MYWRTLPPNARNKRIYVNVEIVLCVALARPGQALPRPGHIRFCFVHRDDRTACLHLSLCHFVSRALRIFTLLRYYSVRISTRIVYTIHEREKYKYDFARFIWLYLAILAVYIIYLVYVICSIAIFQKWRSKIN